MSRAALLTLLTAAALLQPATPPSTPVPWSTLADIPRSAWFRGTKPNETSWTQITEVDDYGVVIQGRSYRVEELRGRFVWSPGPFVSVMKINKCEKASP